MIPKSIEIRVPTNMNPTIQFVIAIGKPHPPHIPCLPINSPIIPLQKIDPIKLKREKIIDKIPPTSTSDPPTSE